MKCTTLVVGCLLWVVSAFCQQPIALHSANPHYFLFRGKPTVLISASEHFGSVLNPAFDYETYLKALHNEGFNYTRIYTGTYVESPDGAFNADERDPLAPSEGGLLCPWARSDEPSYYHGGMKFDLDRWNERYFQRLRDVVALAAQYGIVVEVNFFAGFPTVEAWQSSPMNPNNNINLKTPIGKEQALTLQNGALLDYQVAMTEKIVGELNSFDNVMYKIVDAPWLDAGIATGADVPVTNPDRMAWQTHLADVVTNLEANLTHRHLLVNDPAGAVCMVPQPDARYGVMVFHDNKPDAVRLNAAHSVVIGCDGAVSSDASDSLYVSAAWRVMLSGGGLFNHLDDGFSAIKPDGTDTRPTPSAVNPARRKQLAFLKQFIESFQFTALQPDDTSIQSAGNTYVLSQPGYDYAAYIENTNKGNLTLQFPKGSYQVVFVNVQKGEIFRSEVVNSTGAAMSLPYEHPSKDWALRILHR